MFPISERKSFNRKPKAPGEIVIIGAHYDSVTGSPAANDNGSGVAAVRSLARQFAGSAGDRTLRFIAFVGNTRHSGLVRQVVREFRQNEPFPALGGALPEFMSDIGRSDHWPFWQEGYPALMVTDTAPFRFAHYHTAEDTVDKIDFENTARVVRRLTSVIAALVARST